MDTVVAFIIALVVIAIIVAITLSRRSQRRIWTGRLPDREPRTDSEAAPPDDAGHQGSFTRPEDTRKGSD